ncbi:MAG: helix-turn-helix transcriptional regulator, partial [Roseiflexaceae bacterium]|nr:helix-turn-helix transcriptional regulator [Roseiflexaceae bacterium]
MDETTTSFGYWVRRQRRALDLTQRALADCVGCATATIKKLEADERRPSRQMAERLAVCLRIADDQRNNFLL